MTRPLHGCTVVALEQAVAAPFATSRLADAGARVIKVERPGSGDLARHYDSVLGGESSYFVWLNRGKESVEIDVKKPDDRALLDRLIAKADVLIQNLAPGATERLGLGWREISERHPRLITCDITGYPEGTKFAERRAYDLLIQAETGLISITGSEAEMGRVGISVCDIACGMFAHAAILEALIERGHTGRGRAVHVSLYDAIADWLSPFLLSVEQTGKNWPRVGLGHPLIAPYGAYSTGDGIKVLVGVQNDREWRRLCETVLQNAAIADNPAFATNIARSSNRDALDRLIVDVFAASTASEVERKLDAADISHARINTLLDTLGSGLLRRKPIETPGGLFNLVSPAVTFRGDYRMFGKVPRLGEHNDPIRRDFAP